MRYGRDCKECTSLAAESATLFQEYLTAKDALTQTRKNDSTNSQRRRELEQVTGRLREARKREDFHEETLKRLVKFGEERVRERIRDEPDRPSPDRR